MHATYLLADFTNVDTWLTAGRVVGFVVAGYVITLWLALIYWTYRDITARTNDGWTQALGVATVTLFFIPGFLVYLALRPQELLTEAYARQLETEAFRQEIEKHPACPGCRRAVSDEFIMCPYCRTALRSACIECGQHLDPAWILCPYCASEREAAPRVAAAVPYRTGAGVTAQRPATTPDPRTRPIRPQPSRT
jgi:hypothetical protein